ncbi:unnamed protein product [Rhizophagus irregularis]|uniref:Uncharacterized protein n=2 Tax=Rhizophagus irregularis TaxID=588596 RepID=A0A2I1FF27_9GLOM|nr:hypothetical protein RhiirB3_394442 [Rhizophagus irregularis]CAB5358410.1 unnamed protein product [Rhizophagus irregularis]
MPSRRKKTLQNNNTKNKRGNGSTIETDNTTTSTSCEKTPVISNKTPSREKTPVISTKTPSREKTPAAILTNPATPVTISPIPSSPEKTVITVNIENDDFKDSLSESSEVEEQSQHQKKTGFNNQKGQKYQKLDHLDDTIEPLSNSTFVSSNRKSRKSKSSDTTSLFDDWDNWKSDDQDLHNVRNKTTTPVGKLTKQYLSKETVSQDSVISSEDIDLHEISAAIANILQPENLEDMIRTAVNREVEKRVKLFFDNRADFIFSSSLSHLSSSSSHLSSVSSAPQKRKYRDQNHVITTVMEFTKPLFMKMRNLSDTTLESIINAMWPEKPTFEDESDINVARSKAKKIFQAYRCNLNNDLSQYADIVIERYNKEKNAGRIRFFTKSIITEYVSDDFVREIFNTYMVYTPAMKDDIDALDTLKSFLCRALSFHIGEKLNGNHNHEETLHKIKGLDHITKDLVLKSRLYADVINDI